MQWNIVDDDENCTAKGYKIAMEMLKEITH